MSPLASFNTVLMGFCSTCEGAISFPAEMVAERHSHVYASTFEELLLNLCTISHQCRNRVCLLLQRQRFAESDNSVVSLAKVDTELSADCIEFCPHEGFHEIFVCGTYQVLAPESSKPSAGLEEISEDIQKSEDGDSDEEEVAPKPTQRTGRLLLFRIGEDRSSL